MNRVGLYAKTSFICILLLFVMANIVITPVYALPGTELENPPIDQWDPNVGTGGSNSSNSDAPIGETDFDKWDAYAEENLNKTQYSAYWWASRIMRFCDTTIVDATITWTKGVCFFTVPESTGLGVQTEAYTIVKTIQTVTINIGRILCFLYFFLHLMEHATRDSFTIEVFVRTFAKLMIILVLFNATNIEIISKFLSTVGNELSDVIQIADESTGASLYEGLINDLKSTSFLKTYSVAFTYTVNAIENSRCSVAITSILGSLVALFVGMGRGIELLLYRSMLPLGMSSVLLGGTHSPGFRFLKKLLALEIQGAIMYAAFCLGVAVVKTVSTWDAFLGSTPIASIVCDIAFGIATAAIIARSKRIAQDIVGV